MRPEVKLKEHQVDAELTSKLEIEVDAAQLIRKNSLNYELKAMNSLKSKRRKK